jgi:hypothetical protein
MLDSLTATPLRTHREATMADTTFVETAVLLAEMEEDRDRVDELLAGMSDVELTTFERVLSDLFNRVYAARTSR